MTKSERIVNTTILPSFINVIYHQCTEDKENEQGDKHVVDCPDVVHLKQFTGEKEVNVIRLCASTLTSKTFTEQMLAVTIFTLCDDLLEEGSTTDKELAQAIRRPETPTGKRSDVSARQIQIGKGNIACMIGRGMRENASRVILH